jgi:hypothetical protein
MLTRRRQRHETIGVCALDLARMYVYALQRALHVVQVLRTATS